MSDTHHAPINRVAAVATTLLVGALASYIAWDRSHIASQITGLRQRVDELERSSSLDKAAHETTLTMHDRRLEEYRERGTPYAREQLSGLESRYRERMVAHEQQLERLSDRINSESQSHRVLVDQLWRASFQQPLMERDFFPGTGGGRNNRTTNLPTFLKPPRGALSHNANKPILPELADNIGNDIGNDDGGKPETED